MPTIVISEQPWFYHEHRAEAERPPLFLIHGAGGRHDHWPPQVRRIEGITVIAPDLPGHGRSAGAGRQSILDYANDIVSLMDALEIPQAIVGGHSMGGAIAQMLALTAPERVAGLVLVGTGARLRVAPQILEGIRKDFEQTVEVILEYAYSPAISPDLLKLGRRILQETPVGVLHGDYLACDRFDIMERLDQIHVNALVICGDADLLTPPKYAEYLREHLPDAEMALVPGGGHMVPVEQPEVVAGLIQGWIEAHWPG
jgi:pimeloyl-ACP methyl ester carboxylesterase